MRLGVDTERSEEYSEKFPKLIPPVSTFQNALQKVQWDVPTYRDWGSHRLNVRFFHEKVLDL